MTYMTNTELLDYLYCKLKSILPSMSNYALKGGYIMSNYIAKGYRKTVDIDMSIGDINDFNILEGMLRPLLDSLCSEGEIYSYKFKKPQLKDGRNISGSVKLFRKPSPNNGINQPKRVVCGIDISIHDVSFGVIELEEGIKSFSPERSIADKVSVLYGEKGDILRRCRDLYDLYLFSILNTKIDVKQMIQCLKYRKVDIHCKTTFENLVNSKDKDLVESIKTLITSDKRVDLEFIKNSNLSIQDIILEVLSVLDFLRKEL